VDDLIGKGLEWYVVLELLFYASAYTVPLALPVSVLLSSIMTLGSFGEHRELIAMKSAGISLVRGSKSLLVAVFIISIGGFCFSNFYLPYANLKFFSLLQDIRQTRPALNIQEGMYYNEIEGFSIKIGKKASDNKTVHDVIIYDHSGGKGNDNIIIASRGEMSLTENHQYLVIKLYNGTQYQELTRKRRGKSGKAFQHARVEFKEYEKFFDLSEFNLSRTDESFYKDHYEMLNVTQLSRAVDTLNQAIEKRKKAMADHIGSYFHFKRQKGLDTVYTKNANGESLFESYDISTKQIVVTRAVNHARAVRNFVSFAKKDIEIKQDFIIRHQAEQHKKVTLSLACIVLFLIGAPLGAIIRVGGLGWPLVIAIFLFIFYYVIFIISEKFVKEGVILVHIGMWIPTFIFLPFGMFLSHKVIRESVLFNKESYLLLLNKFFKKFNKAK